METFKATKEIEIDFMEIDREEIRDLFEARIKSFDIFGIRYTPTKQRVINDDGEHLVVDRNGDSFDFVLKSLSATLSDGDVVTSSGEIFNSIEDLEEEYIIEEDETTNEDEN